MHIYSLHNQGQLVTHLDIIRSLSILGATQRWVLAYHAYQQDRENRKYRNVLAFQPLYTGVSKNMGYPKMDGSQWKSLLKWMIWGYHYFWKHPYIHIIV